MSKSKMGVMVSSKKRLVAVVFAIILCLNTAGFVQAQNVYQNNNWHFSFTIPDGWEQMSKEAIDAWSDEASQATGRRIMAIVGFQKKDGGRVPRIALTVDSSGRMTESKLLQMVGNKSQQAAFQRDIKKYSPKDIIKNTEYKKMEYDGIRKMLYIKAITATENFNLVNVMAMMVSSYGYVTLGFYSKEADFDGDANDYSIIIESFKFDEGYKY